MKYKNSNMDSKDMNTGKTTRRGRRTNTTVTEPINEENFVNDIGYLTFSCSSIQKDIRMDVNPRMGSRWESNREH